MDAKGAQEIQFPALLPREPYEATNRWTEYGPNMFLMKDSYSFDLTDEGLAESYAKHRDAYIKIFDRLGLRFVIVSATSGAMGGSASEEFLAESETGEDTYVRGPGGYAANVEAVVTPAPPAQAIDGKPPAQVHYTPDTPTID